MNTRNMTMGVLVCMALLAAKGNAGLFSGWQHSLPIGFQNCPASEPLVNFPALVILGTQAGFDYSQFQSGSNNDLRFTDASGTQELNYEIEQWNPSGNSTVWVQVPVLTNGTSITAYWGKSGVSAPAYTTNGATWSLDYKAVWHLCGTNDSTASRRDIAPGGSSAGPVPGAVANGYAFNYNNLDGGICNTLGWSSPTKFTVSWWMNVPYGPTWSIGDNQWATWLAHSSGYGLVVGTMNGADARFVGVPDTGNVIDYGQWTHFTYTFDNGAMALFKSGNLVCSKTVAVTLASWSLFNIWRASSGAGAGTMDEVQLSSVARSSNWVWASYMTMASNTAFTTYGKTTGVFSTWQYRLSVVFTNYPAAEPLTYFPVLVKLGPQIDKFDYSQFWSGSNADLRFADNAQHELNYEIEQWATNGTSCVWVQVPALTNGTSITAYWGKSGVSAPSYTTNGATWSQDYEAVWHLCGTNDSTSHRLDVAPGAAGAGPAPAAAANGYAFSYNAANGGVCGNLNWQPTEFTVSWWMNLPSSLGGIGDNWGTFLGHSSGLGLYIGTDIGTRFTPTETGNVVDYNQWNSFAFTFDNGTATLFKSGRQVCTKTGMTLPAAWNVYQIWMPAGPAAYTGYMDEVELSSVGRSSNWVWASYMTMASNTVFQGYGRVVQNKPRGTSLMVR
ncbi:MAG: DUF2341 domain-containing protein [Kiritimatiellae bacterium]|nr:DUF2341 domain-containing protein [Kiritimatiellia bacterium]